MWSSKSVIALSLITAVVAIIVSSFIRNKVNKYIEDCAVKLAQTKSAPAKNENFMASALNKIESNKNDKNVERPQDVAQVIPQTSNVVQPVQEKKEPPPPPLGSGVRWTPI